MLITENKLRDYTLGLLILLPTFYNISHYMFLLPVIYIIILYPSYGIKMNLPKKTVHLALFILILSCINYYIFGYENIHHIKDYIAYFLLYIFVFLIASKINKNVLISIIYVIVFESVFVIVEHFLGINTVFVSDLNFRTGLLAVSDYSARTFGLSSGINTMAMKLFIAYLLHSLIFKSKNMLFFITKALLLYAIYVNYGRSVIVAIGLLLLIEIYQNKNLRIYYISMYALVIIHFIYINGIDFFLLNTIGLVPFVKHIIMISIEMLKQLIYAISIVYLFLSIKKLWIHSRMFIVTRIALSISIIIIISLLSISSISSISSKYSGRNSKDITSYRDIIYSEGIAAIKKRPLMGNNSHKYYVYLKAYNAYEHLHNSFLELMTTNGITIFLLYILFILMHLNKFNLIAVGLIILYSFTQYGIFWGISFLDIIFIYLLVFYKKSQEESSI